jgi:hypothetical protein
MAWQVWSIAKGASQIAHLVKPVLMGAPGAVNEHYRQLPRWQRLALDVMDLKAS